MKPKAGRYVYTNVGFKPNQHRLLKHLAVEERKDLADLVRDAVDMLIEKKSRQTSIPYEGDFVLFKMGRTWFVQEDRPYQPGDWSPIDRDLYGPDSGHGRP